MMKRLRQHLGTRRQLFRVMAAGAASVPFLALAKKFAAQGVAPDVRRHPVHCLLKGTRISTPSGDRPVHERQIGDEGHTVAGRKPSSGSATKNSERKKAELGRARVRPVRVPR